MKEKNELVTVVTKPEFKGEIVVEITGLAKIEDNIKEVKEFAIGLNNYYKSIIFTEDTMKDATEEKAKVNKFKDKVAEYRKNVTNQVMENIKDYVDISKEVETLLGDTYSTINDQVNKFNDSKKETMRIEVEEFFNEYRDSKGIDFVEYANANINVTLSASMKKLKEEAQSFIDRIVNDLELINEEDLKNEIMVEYKKTLNASASILEVKRRAKAIEDEKIRQQQIADRKAQEAQVVAKVEETVVATAPVVEAPKVEVKEQRMTFTVYGTVDQLIEVKKFLIKGGYKYE